MKLLKRKRKTCDFCIFREGSHYCLLHTQQVKNMDIYGCEDWEEMQVNVEGSYENGIRNTKKAKN